MAPSPTAEATRFTEPWRTSPAANMPGTRVSRPRRPGAVDRQVVFRARRVGEPAELLGHLADRRRLHAGAIREFADRQARRRVAFERDPLEGNIAAVQEIAQLVRLGRAQPAIDLHERRLSAAGIGHGQSYRPSTD